MKFNLAYLVLLAFAPPISLALPASKDHTAIGHPSSLQEGYHPARSTVTAQGKGDNGDGSKVIVLDIIDIVIVEELLPILSPISIPPPSSKLKSEMPPQQLPILNPTPPASVPIRPLRFSPKQSLDRRFSDGSIKRDGDSASIKFIKRGFEDGDGPILQVYKRQSESSQSIQKNQQAQNALPAGSANIPGQVSQQVSNTVSTSPASQVVKTVIGKIAPNKRELGAKRLRNDRGGNILVGDDAAAKRSTDKTKH